MSRIEIIGDATLILGDCRDYFASNEAPVTGWDAIVTDPPYLFSTSGGGIFRRQGRTCMDEIAENGLDEGFDIDEIPLSLVQSAVIFCHNDQLPDLLPKVDAAFDRFALCAWHKLNPMPVANKHYQPDTEFYIHAWRKGAAPIGALRDKSRYIMANCGVNEYKHPTQKPLDVMGKIIANVHGDVILDPFMGTGSTGIAALKAGRKFVGVEKNPVYFETARKRIELFERQGDFFIEKPSSFAGPDGFSLQGAG